MNKKKIIVFITCIILTFLVSFGIFKVYSNHKIKKQEEARFDHFMNYWYAFYDQYNADVEIYTRMKKGIILDYIQNKKGRYIYEQAPLYGGGTFSIRQFFYIKKELEGWWISHRAVFPIESAPKHRKEERWAFWHMYYCGRELTQIDEYDENLGTNIDYLESTFNKIDSLAHEIHKGFVLLERYKSSQFKNTDINTLNNISNSEYKLDNY